MEQNVAAFEAGYKIFIEKVAASKQVWGLKNKSGWANAESGADEAVAVIPVWSDRGLAKACARDDWKSFLPTEIQLSDFLENWCMGMVENGTLIGINWDTKMQGIESDALSVTGDMLLRLQEINSAIRFKNYSSIDEFIADIEDEDEED